MKDEGIARTAAEQFYSLAMYVVILIFYLGCPLILIPTEPWRGAIICASAWCRARWRSPPMASCFSMDGTESK
jgi:hypothetical protein